MTEKEVLKYGEIQYLKGRLDELFKSLPNVVELQKSRKLDQRIEKYLNKLRSVDEISYNLYQVELKTRYKSKERSKKEIKSLLEEILETENIINDDLKSKILKKIDSY
jgi:DNA anti-recombination protein RmuC